MTKKSTVNTKKGADSEVQERADAEAEQGFRGVEVDPTPNENYTVAGVTSEKPTPETDAGAAAKARESTGLGVSNLEQNAKKGDK